jgi:hypothetical protein
VGFDAGTDGGGEEVEELAEPTSSAKEVDQSKNIDDILKHPNTTVTGIADDTEKIVTDGGSVANVRDTEKEDNQGADTAAATRAVAVAKEEAYRLQVEAMSAFPS